MPHRADLDLARIHLDQLQENIEEQQLRISLLKEKGQPTKSAEDLLKVLSQTRGLILDYIERTTPAASAGNLPSENQPS
jgi:hypothetical protein